MKTREIVFNGKYMCKKQCRGVQRYTKEVLHALDGIENSGNIKVIIPHKVNEIDTFSNIQVVKYGGFFTNKFWQYLGFQMYIWTHKAFCICLSDGIPFFNIGIAAIHDVRYLDDIKKSLSTKAKLGMRITTFISKRAIKKSKNIVTVSNFSKEEILKAYGEKYRDKICVCYNAWQHLLKIPVADNIFQKWPFLEAGEYYFALGGNEESKNMIWIKYMIEKYPDRMFIMAGPQNLFFPSEGINLDVYKNYKHLGYISDSELKALMKHCRAFLFPSKYEGFGIPPMEAISVGAKALVSNAACLPEIYRSYVRYFDPDNYDVNLDELVDKYPIKSKDVLQLYSWKKTAEDILKIARNSSRK